MQPLLTLIRRELGGYFNSLTGYVIIAAVQFLVALALVLLLESLNGKPFDVPVTEAFFNHGLFWLILLIAAPIITMRTFALEKFSGTYETLMTAPVSDAQVVLAKFIGALVFFLVTWLPVATYPHLLRHYSVDLPRVDNGMLASTLLGIFLFGSLYVSLGCFASSLTRNQIIAAMNAFVMGLGIFLFSLLPLILPPQPGWQTKLLTHISMIEHMRDFSRGIVDTSHVVFYASFTFLFLFLTFKVVESRRWK